MKKTGGRKSRDTLPLKREILELGPEKNLVQYLQISLHPIIYTVYIQYKYTYIYIYMLTSYCIFLLPLVHYTEVTCHLAIRAIVFKKKFGYCIYQVISSDDSFFYILLYIYV